MEISVVEPTQLLRLARQSKIIERLGTLLSQLCFYACLTFRKLLLFQLNGAIFFFSSSSNKPIKQNSFDPRSLAGQAFPVP